MRASSQPHLHSCAEVDAAHWMWQVEWGKGHALAHLLGALGLEGATDVVPIYIGDDRTDEVRTLCSFLSDA